MKSEFAVASASWPDHLVFGEGDGRLNTPGALERRMENWKEEMGARIIHWREVRTRMLHSRYYSSPTNPRTQQKAIAAINWDDFEVVTSLAHRLGMAAYLYVSVLDVGRPLADAAEREKSFHNAMHGQHVTWQMDWSRDHPGYTIINRDGSMRQEGVLCFGYPEVRRHMVEHIEALIADHDFDGVFLCLRSQCKPADFADQFGFNDPVRDDYQSVHGKDIWKEDFDLPSWRCLLGGYISHFLRDLRPVLRKRNMQLSVGLPRGEIIGPPMGNWTLEWRKWVQEGLVDEIIVDQNSSQCPSMWHLLWPMHRGYGYLQNYIDGYNLKPLKEDLQETYSPVLAGSSTRLYLARQWTARDPDEESNLLSIPVVSGLVFSTFRHDNPGAVQRGDFRA